MRSVTCTNAELAVVDGPEPTPEAGQVRIEVVRCGICGSDLHARHGIDEWNDLASTLGYERFGRSDQSVVFGHEFSGTVAEYGTGCRQDLPTGTPVVALPIIRNPHGVDTTGLSVHAPGAYAEQTVVQESLMIGVPNGLPADVAALTEPMAVAWHAVQRSEIRKKDVAIVIGCGPVGLGVILGLKAKGVRNVVATDFSPGRRALAMRCGADVVVDAAVESPYDVHGDDHLRNAADVFDLAIDVQERFMKAPVEPWHIWRVVDKLKITPKAPVVFECVGVPGVIESIVQQAPIYSRVVVVGVCVGEDRFTPAMAINKEIDFKFVLGYTPLEFRDTLHMLAEGRIDPRPLITGEVGLEGVENAFVALGDPERHAKILVDPKSEATAP